MKARRRLSNYVLAALRESKGLLIRAGTAAHRFIGIWFVIVKDCVFVRSRSVKPNGWYRVFLKEPRGTIRTAHGEIAIRAVRIQTQEPERRC